jgi:hypothetical protein
MYDISQIFFAPLFIFCFFRPVSFLLWFFLPTSTCHPFDHTRDTRTVNLRHGLQDGVMNVSLLVTHCSKLCAVRIVTESRIWEVSLLTKQFATKTCCDRCLQRPVRNKQLLLRGRNSNPEKVNQVSSCAFYLENLRTRGFTQKRTAVL